MIKSFFVFVTLPVFALMACGKPRVNVPVQVPLKVQNTSPSNSKFYLSESGLEQEFSGALVLWDKNIQGPQLTRLLNATRDYNQSYANYSASLQDSIDNVLNPKQEFYKQALVGPDKAIFEFYRNNASVSLDAAKVWFDNRIEQMTRPEVTEAVPASPLPLSAEAVQANRVFHKYCDAKIFEWAVSKLSVLGEFSTRPTPAAVCENYYQASRYFDPTNTECAPPAAGVKKNFSNCIWNQGVLKTSYVVGERPQIESPEAYANLIRSNSFQQALLLKDDGASTNCSRLTYVSDTAPTPVSVKRSELLKIMLAENGRKLGTGFVKHTRLSCDSVEAKVSFLQTVPQSALVDVKSPFDMIAAVEGNNATAPEGLRFFPNKSEYSIELSTVIGAVSKQDLACSLDQTFSDTTSLNHIVFNVSNSSLSYTCPSYSRVGLPSFMPINPNTETLGAGIEPARLDYVSAKDQICRLNDAPCDAAVQSDLQRSYCGLTKARIDKLTAVGAPGVSAVMVRSFLLKISPLLDGKISVFMSLNGAAYAQGCFASFESGASVDCGNGLVDSAVVRMDPATRKITVTKPILDTSLLVDTTGFVRSDVAAEILGKTLKIEMYPNRFQSVSNGKDYFIPYLSGKAFVLDGDSELYQGTASYLIDERTDANRVEQACR